MKKWKRKKRNGRKEMRGACGSEKNWGPATTLCGSWGGKKKQKTLEGRWEEREWGVGGVVGE